MSAEDIYNDACIRRWMDSTGYAKESRAEQLALIRLVADFCESREETPQELIDSCFLEKTADGQYEISIKGRRAMNQAIDEFASRLPMARFYQVAAGNSIRGFLVHNGVLVQGKPVLP